MKQKTKITPFLWRFIMNLLKKVKGAGSSVAVNFNAKLVALCVFLVALASYAAQDYSALSTEVTSNLSGLSTVLMTIAGTIIGVVVVVVAFRFVKRMLG
jgi:hypothetical protein